MITLTNVDLKIICALVARANIGVSDISGILPTLRRLEVAVNSGHDFVVDAPPVEDHLGIPGNHPGLVLGDPDSVGNR